MAKDLELTAKVAADLFKRALKDEALKKLIDAWNIKNAKAGKRVGTFGFMAAALAACGGGGNGGGGGANNPVLRLISATGEVFDAADPVEIGGLLSVTSAPVLLSPNPVVAGKLTIAANETYVGDISLFDAAGEGIVVEGEGNLWILAPAEGFTGVDQTVTLDIDLSGGTLTFDMQDDTLNLRVKVMSNTHRADSPSLSRTEEFSAEGQMAGSALAVSAANPNTRSPRAVATVITTVTEQRCCAAA